MKRKETIDKTDGYMAGYAICEGVLGSYYLRGAPTTSEIWFTISGNPVDFSLFMWEYQKPITSDIIPGMKIIFKTSGWSPLSNEQEKIKKQLRRVEVEFEEI